MLESDPVLLEDRHKELGRRDFHKEAKPAKLVQVATYREWKFGYKVEKFQSIYYSYQKYEAYFKRKTSHVLIQFPATTGF